MNKINFRNPVLIITAILAVVAVIFMVRLMITTANKATNSNEEQSTSVSSTELPAGVTQSLVDSVGPFVARAAYNVDLTVDSNANSALLRNASMVLTQSYIEDLNTMSRSSMYVEHSTFDKMREENIVKLIPSTAISDSERAVDSDNRAMRVYRLSVSPIYEDDRAESISISIQVDFLKMGSNWFVNSIKAA